MLSSRENSAQTNLLQFPTNFVWGAATAAYQIEGAADEGGRGESIWDRFCATPGKVADGASGAVACDHYHLWREDIGLMQQVGLQAYRFSIAWPRILPDGTGRINQAGLDFYDQLVDGLLEAGIQPYATLYHWDLPQVLQDKGGWANRATAYAFAEYAEVVLKRLGDRVKGWITHNEPWCAAFLGYKIGCHAPGLTDERQALAAVHHLLLSHGLAMPLIRQFAPDAEAGITLNPVVAQPFRDGDPDDERFVRAADCEQNRLFFDPLFGKGYPQEHRLMQELASELVQPGDLEIIATPMDFLGLNYYSRTVLKADPTVPGGVRYIQPPGIYTTMGWEVYPQGLYELLARLHKEYPARYLITENGASSDDLPDESGKVEDRLRLNYLREHLEQAHRAIEAGIPLAGYFAWSFLDNFEWAFGYKPRFGLTYVDYATQERILKESARWYAQVIKNNAVERSK